MMPDEPTGNESDARIAQTEAHDHVERPPRRRPGQVHKIHTVAGLPDIFAEGAPARELRRIGRQQPDLSAYRGHERPVIANLEDDD
jgi:hypothetical protein